LPPVAIKRTPLRQRLVVAFVLLTGTVSGLFSLATFVAIEQYEEDLFVRQIDGELRWWIAHLGNTPQPRPLPLANKAHLYVTPDMPASRLPAFLARQNAGWREVFDGKDTYQVVRRDLGGRRYYLVQPASQLERHERGWLLVLAVGTLAAVLAAYFLARLMASSVLEPVLRLAQRVRHADPARAPRRLAAGFADDEIGELARVFEQRLGQLHDFIASERLFTSDVSHELRTPVAIIAGAAETLLARSELLPRARAAIERIDTAALEMQDLIDAFLALGRAPGAQATQAPPCLVNSVLATELRRLRTQPGAPTLVLDEQAQVTLPCPAPLLTVAVRNLLDNATRYAPAGEVRVTLQADALIVDDTGAGLAEADISRAFDRHQRLGAELPGGEGLGLAIVQRICERLGWKVEAQARPQGMRFVLRFGLETAPPDPAPNTLLSAMDGSPTSP
jgi:signal transduction histidine kinase